MIKYILILTLFISISFSNELGFKGLNLNDDYKIGCEKIQEFEKEIAHSKYIEKEGMFCALTNTENKKFLVSTFFKDNRLASIIYSKDFIDTFSDNKTENLDDVVAKMIQDYDFQGQVSKKQMLANTPNPIIEYILGDENQRIEISVFPNAKIILKKVK